MAKRKRLTPPQPGYLRATGASGPRAPETKSMPGALPGALAGGAPIAQVAGDIATRAALDEVSATLQAARAEGRMIELLAPEAIDENYLVRDRLQQDPDDMASLMASLRARGQQTPIEVIRLPDAAGQHSHGLISGWRRLSAMQRLYSEEKDPKFASIKALVIAPDNAQQAYVAMVEENEIRAGLSLYERARIALRAAREGVYPTPRHALLGLFAATSRSKRSKIGRFVLLVEALDPALRFPTAIPEKLGLGLARALEAQADFAENLRNRLETAAPGTATDELRLLTSALAVRGAQASAPAVSPAPPAPPVPPTPTPAPASRTIPRRPHLVVPGVILHFDRALGRIALTGDKVDETMCLALKDWLKAGEG